MKNLYDDDKIPLVATIKGEKAAVAKVKEVKFIPILVKDGVESEQAAITAAVQKGFPDSQAKHDYQPPAVDDGLDYYDFKYRVEIEDSGKPTTKIDGAETFRIWPTKVEVTFTSDDNQAHKKCRFKIKKGGIVGQPKASGDDGKWSERVGTATWEVVPEPPYALVDPINHKGKKRSYKIKKAPYKVEFVSPVVKDPSKTIKQYVNLDPDAAGWSEAKAFGHELSFKVGAEGDLKRAAGAKLGQKDDYVYIQVDFTPATKRNVPKPKLLDDGLDGAAVGSNNDQTWKGKIKLGADGQATFKVELGYGGGDVCEVKIGGTDTCGDASLKYETWRRLYYELLYPDFMGPDLKDLGSGKHDFPDSIKTKADARLAAVFIEYKLKSSHPFTKAKAVAGTVITGEFLGEPGRDRLIQGSSFSSAPPVPFDAAEPRTIQITLADRTLSTRVSDKAESPDLVAVESKFTNGKFFTPFSLNVTGCNWTAQVNPNAYHAAPTLSFEDASTPDVVNRACAVTVLEVNQGKTLSLEFQRDDKHIGVAVLSATEQGKIAPFVLSCLDAAALQRTENKVKFKLTWPTNGTPIDGQRKTVVQAALQSSFDTQKQPVYYHPGCNPDGTARSGAVDAAWFKASKVDELTITLPTSAKGQPIKPGDFAGALSAKACPVKVAFSVKVTYAINGNSGSGEQLFQLRPLPRQPGAMASTLCHELGHAMGMTIVGNSSKVPPGMDPALHVDSAPTKGPYYVDGSAPYTNGKRSVGAGEHCATGVPNTAPHDFNGGSGTCIMFHSGGDPDSRPSYCAVCAGYLKGRKLVDIRTGWSGRTSANS